MAFLIVVVVLVAGAVGWLAWRSRHGTRLLDDISADELHAGYMAACSLADAGDPDAAAGRFESVLADSVRIHGEAAPFTLELMGLLASVRIGIGDLDGALDLRQRAHAAAPEGVDRISTLIDLAAVHLVRRELDEARRCYREALDAARRELHGMHPEVGAAMVGLARAAAAQGDTEAAVLLLGEAAEHSASTVGIDHPDRVAAARDHSLLAAGTTTGAELARGDLLAALRIRREALVDAEARYGEDHREVVVALNALGEVLRELRDTRAAYRAYERASALCTHLPGGPHREALVADHCLVRVMLIQGDARNADEVLADLPAPAEYRTWVHDRAGE
jgi:tetratricopeptide (TPR) repeat protein